MSRFPGLRYLFPNRFPVNFIKLQYAQTCESRAKCSYSEDFFGPVLD